MVHSIQSYSAVDTEEFVVHIIELSIVKVKFIIVSILQFMVWFKQSVQCTVNSEQCTVYGVQCTVEFSCEM